MADLFASAGRFWPGLALGCVLLVVIPASGASLDERLLADAADGRLDEIDFVTAALIASGVSDACELAHWRARYADLRSATLGTLPGGSANDRFPAVQAALHERILVGSYQATASDLRTTIARGDFNCLTALAVNWDLCHAAGLPVEIGSFPGHVSLRTAKGTWIEPGVRQQPAPGKLKRTLSRRLSAVELLGKFYYNRGVEQLRQAQFADGQALLQISLQLDPADSDARENLLAGFNNWAVEHCRQRRYDLAAPLIARGLAIEPSFAPLVANERLVQQKLRQ